MAYHTSVPIAGRQVAIYITEGPVPSNLDEIHFKDPETGKPVIVTDTITAWAGSSEMQPPPGAVPAIIVRR